MLDESDTVTIDILATIHGLATSVIGPAGEVIDETTVSAFGGEFVSFETPADTDEVVIVPVLSQGFHSVFRFPSLGPGTYSARFEADPALTEEVAVATRLLTDSLLGAALITTETTITLVPL